MTSTSRIMALLLAATAVAACNDGNRDDGLILKPIDADAADSDAQEVTPIPKLEAGDACERNDQCDSGVCAAASAEGKICSSACSDSVACPAGLVCVRDDGAGVCVKTDVVACQPCRVDGDCNVAGLSGNKCLDYGAGGSFCGNGCSATSDCASGYTCEANACKLTTGECACNAAGIALGAETDCEVSNAEGTCHGVRGCGTGGLSRCYAETPAAETCNGRDDDCDGETDEGTNGANCDLTNEFGVCHGTVECTAGRPLCVGRVPAAEICNGVDDNCDGQTDEGSPDLDEDGIADCLDDDWDNDGTKNVDDCMPRNPDVHPANALHAAPPDVCNGIDDDCDRLVDNGEAASCGCYVCGGEAGCLTSCESNDDVVDGFVCALDDSDDNGDHNECVQSVCGNEIVEPGELCDDGENLGRYGGCFACTKLGGFCGDGTRQFAFELCDDGDLNGEPGKCNDTCSGITGPSCGNGLQEEGEQCDLGHDNSNQPNATCRTDCMFARCGDGIVDPSREETCDRGNLNGQDGTCGCTANCSYPSPETTCRAAVGVCDAVERCDGNGACPTDAKRTGFVCGPKVGDCDVAETCTGASNTCPGDAVATSAVVCRTSGGDCDVAETCDGTSKDCPADAYAAPSAVCRVADGDCDQPENCTGQGPRCPDDSFFGSSKVCRPSAGGCDVAESCSGESRDCPSNLFVLAGVVCHDPLGDCDANVTCTGESADCAYDGPLQAGTVCRFGFGTCDPDEACDGESFDCPDDLVADNTTVCHASEGDCDAVETCDGAGGCPDDSFFGFGTACRASTGFCDPAEFCEGNSTQCPRDLVYGPEVTCHGAAGECDTNATCDGVNGACPYLGVQPPTFACHPSRGDCDPAEMCDGVTVVCPPDLLADNTTVCRDADGGCDVPEYCDGVLVACPTDLVANNATVCNPGDGACDPQEACDGVTKLCPDDVVADDGSDCTGTTDCTGASCTCMAGVCEADPTGRVWCFKRVTTDGADEFTLLPTDPDGPAVVAGPGLKIDAANNNTPEFVGNADYPSECPDVVGEGAMGYAQFDGDTSVGASGSGRLFCDGNPQTVPSATDPGAANNTLAAAIECGDYYQFVASTGPSVAFEFEERSPTGGPTNWALLVSLTGVEGSFVRAGGGLTNGPGVSAFTPTLVSPYHTVYLDDFVINGEPVTNHLDVYFRLYAWNASSATYWIVDNVRVNPPRVAQQRVWINEFSYDNDQVDDAGEFVEVAGVAGKSLAGWKIELTNGANGQRYKVDNLTGALSSDPSGVGYAVLDYATVSGGAFQNGAPDGLALLSPDNQVIEFLSYEGSPFMGVATASATTTSAAASVLSVDVGVSQNTTPVAQSLQRSGLFCLSRPIPSSWIGPVTATKGAVNGSQTIGCDIPL